MPLNSGIWRPSNKIETEIRIRVETLIRSKYRHGVYKERDAINAIIKDYFGFYERILKSTLPKIASFELMTHVLEQYDVSCNVDINELIGPERKWWANEGPYLRRALKYLAERTLMLWSENPVIEFDESFFDKLDFCMVCAEQLVWLSILSEQTFSIFPEETVLEILPPNQDFWFDLRIEDAEKYLASQQRIANDTQVRKQYIDESRTFFNEERIKSHLDEHFEHALGMKISDVFDFISNLNSNVTILEENGNMPFVSEEQILAALQQDYALTINQAKVVLEGISLRKSKMLEEGREIWKPKQEYRAYFRPFFEIPHETGVHFIWSQGMARESIHFMYIRLAHKLLPNEWKQRSLNKPLGDYEKQITKEFENIVIENLRKVRLSAARFNKCIGSGPGKLYIPNQVGEIDLLAFCPDNGLLIVGDCKVVKAASEPVHFRDDLTKFVNGKKNYIGQVNRKTDWILGNLKALEKSLQTSSDFPDDIAVKSVAPILVTYYPSFASYFVANVPIVALTELMTSLKSYKGWEFPGQRRVRGS